MPRIPFSELPDDARLWVFPLSRALSSDQEAEVRDRIDAFLDLWATHGAPLTSGREWVEGRFLLVAVDEATAPPSGCSIDGLARVLKGEGARLGMSFLDQGPVWFRQDGALVSVSREAFRALAEAGEVGADTIVFDNAVTRLSQVRGGEWEKRAGDSWHGKVFFRSTS